MCALIVRTGSLLESQCQIRSRRLGGPVVLKMEATMRLSIAALACVVLTPTLSHAAEQPCSERKQIVEFLGRAHAEFLVGRGVSTGGRMVEIFASGAGSWSVIWSSPSGTSCLVASGEGWEQSKNDQAARDLVQPPRIN